MNRPSSGAKARSGLAVGFAVLALVAVPAAVTALFALASVRYSEPPEPSVGALWAGLSALLLTLPVIAGVLVARNRAVPRESVPSERRWLPIVVATTVVIAAWQLLRRVV